MNNAHDNHNEPTIPPVAIERDQQQRELVAYLDGEVTDTDRVRIEKRLATDEEYRHHLVELERSWNLLDSLPVIEVDGQFTESTMSMAAVAVRQNELAWWKSSRRWLAIGAALAAGFLLMGAPRALKRQAELRDVPVIHNMDLYAHADSLEFLRMLDEQDIFSEIDDSEL